MPPLDPLNLDKRYKFAKMDPELVARNQDVIDAMQLYPLEQNAWIAGQPGTGKTHVAMCAGNRHAYNGQRVQFQRGVQLKIIAEKFSDEREEALTPIYACELLIIDDLDKATPTPRFLEVFWTLMDTRYKWRRRTIVTANCTPAALATQWAKVKDVNHSTITAALDRLNPCYQFIMQADESLRRRIVQPARLLERVTVVQPVEDVEFSNAVQEAFLRGDVRALVKMEGVA